MKKFLFLAVAASLAWAGLFDTDYYDEGNFYKAKELIYNSDEYKEAQKQIDILVRQVDAQKNKDLLNAKVRFATKFNSLSKSKYATQEDFNLLKDEYAINLEAINAKYIPKYNEITNYKNQLIDRTNKAISKLATDITYQDMENIGKVKGYYVDSHNGKQVNNDLGSLTSQTIDNFQSGLYDTAKTIGNDFENTFDAVRDGTYLSAVKRAFGGNISAEDQAQINKRFKENQNNGTLERFLASRARANAIDAQNANFNNKLLEYDTDNIFDGNFLARTAGHLIQSAPEMALMATPFVGLPTLAAMKRQAKPQAKL